MDKDYVMHLTLRNSLYTWLVFIIEDITKFNLQMTGLEKQNNENHTRILPHIPSVTEYVQTTNYNWDSCKNTRHHIISPSQGF